MTLFVAKDKDIEVNGESILSIVEGMKFSSLLALKLLKENGIADPKPGEWYSQQKWLDTFSAITKRLGELTLYTIGREVPKNAKWPPEINNIEKGLASIDIAYHMNHRKNGEILFNPQTQIMKEGIGHYLYKKIEDKKAEIVCDNPYPCSFDEGLIEAVAGRFLPEKAKIIIQHDQQQPCRKRGNDSCLYIITWH
ncbi:MAG: hypothetical protein ABIG46_03220 [Candidatus Omnitrophota bacterium]